MMTNNFAMYSLKIVGEIVRDILMFPVWWYTRGLVGVARSLFSFLEERQRSLALLVWIKNIYRPMYGQHDWQGILISIGMRIIQIIFRSLVMLFWVLAVLFIFCFWLVFPLFLIYEIFFQLNAYVYT
jgi:hypothetical protein